MKIAMLHGPRDLRIEEHHLDTSNLGADEIWVETQITAFKIGTDRGNYEGAERVPGAPDYPRWVGDSNLGIVRGVGIKSWQRCARYQVGHIDVRGVFLVPAITADLPVGRGLVFPNRKPKPVHSIINLVL